MIITTPYATTLGSSFNHKKTPSQLAAHYSSVGGDSDIVNMYLVGKVLVVDVEGEVSDVPLFSQPLVYVGSISNSLTDKATHVVFVDQRPFTRIKNETRNVVNPREYALGKVKGVLTAKWVSEEYDDLKADGSVAGSTFCNVVASVVANQYGLDPLEKLKISVIASIYYGQMFSDGGVPSLIVFRDAMKWTGAKPPTIDEIVDSGISVSPGMNGLAQAIANYGGAKVKNLDAGILLSLLGNIFYGYNNKELIAMSIEYPPLWMAMVFIAITDKSFSNTYLARVSNTQVKRGKATPLVKLVNNLI